MFLHSEGLSNTFQSYSDSRPWLWTSDFDCYEMNGACQLLLIDYY